VVGIGKYSTIVLQKLDRFRFAARRENVVTSLPEEK